MEHVELGRTELKISRLCLGTMQFGWSADEPLSHRVLSAAYEAGINFLDTADVYSNWVQGNPGGVSEEIIGRWMKQARIRRDRLVIATKVRGRMWEGADGDGLGRAHIVRAAEESLRRLGSDYIDLYQTHWPDEKTPIEETLHAFDDLIRQGKVRYIGCSNYTAGQLQEALDVSVKLNLPRFEALQPHYNLIHRAEFEAQLADLCRTQGLGVIPYSPLAGGFLTGKYRRGQPLPESVRAEGRQKLMTEENFALLDKLDEIAVAHKATVSQVALAWLLANPIITSPIIGPNKVEQLQDNLAALSVRLNAEEKKGLDDLSAWQE